MILQTSRTKQEKQDTLVASANLPFLVFFSGIVSMAHFAILFCRVTKNVFKYLGK